MVQNDKDFGRAIFVTFSAGLAVMDREMDRFLLAVQVDFSSVFMHRCTRKLFDFTW